jgi:hypothetical protein
VIDASERAFANHVPVIVGPTANLWVESIDQVGGRHAMCSFDSSSDAIQEGFNILLGRPDEQFPVRISAHVLSEEIKAVLHVRNDVISSPKAARFYTPNTAYFDPEFKPQTVRGVPLAVVIDVVYLSAVLVASWLGFKRIGKKLPGKHWQKLGAR